MVFRYLGTSENLNFFKYYSVWFFYVFYSSLLRLKVYTMSSIHSDRILGWQSSLTVATVHLIYCTVDILVLNLPYEIRSALSFDPLQIYLWIRSIFTCGSAPDVPVNPLQIYLWIRSRCTCGSAPDVPVDPLQNCLLEQRRGQFELLLLRTYVVCFYPC